MKAIAMKIQTGTIAKYVLLTLGVILCANALQAQPQREMFRRVMPSVVVIHAQKKAVAQTKALPAARSLGSGTLISAEGLVLTTAQVVQAVDRVEVEFFDGQRVSARVLAAVPYADVALLQVDKVPEKAVVAKLGDSASTKVGDQVFMIGSPAGATPSLSVGWISARSAAETPGTASSALETLQLDAALRDGNLGSPVFNLKGEVIGLVSQASEAKSSGVVVTSNVVRRLLLKESRK